MNVVFVNLTPKGQKELLKDYKIKSKWQLFIKNILEFWILDLTLKILAVMMALVMEQRRSLTKDLTKAP